jgi:hypothetical protein
MPGQKFVPNPNDYKQQSILTKSIQSKDANTVSVGPGIKRIVATQPAPSTSGGQPVKKANAPGPQPVKKANAPGPLPVKKPEVSKPAPKQVIEENPTPAPVGKEDIYFESDDEDDLTGWNS